MHLSSYHAQSIPKHTCAESLMSLASIIHSRLVEMSWKPKELIYAIPGPWLTPLGGVMLSALWAQPQAVLLQPLPSVVLWLWRAAVLKPG